MDMQLEGNMYADYICWLKYNIKHSVLNDQNHENDEEIYFILLFLLWHFYFK